ncbi:MAG: flagellar assembly protein FliH [Gammaproteobacteria bacterium]|nr:flagellar assembly protein FliH [Gammaproteobacteria bacterium]
MSESDPGKSAKTGDIKRWEVPAIDGSADKGFLTAGRMQDLQKQAWDEAYEAGRQEGLQAGSEESRARVERLDQLLVALARPFDELDETVENQLVELAMTVVKQLFRRELRIDPTHIIGVVRDAIKLLPAASRDVQVHLHPEDAALVRESLSPSEGERAWKIVEDPLINKGGCKITTENSQIDAQAETRLQAVISAIAGDERQQ